ncbi:hypothetical protein ACWEQ4_01010 [Rhodococcus sp. NPDC003994]
MTTIDTARMTRDEIIDALNDAPERSTATDLDGDTWTKQVGVVWGLDRDGGFDDETPVTASTLVDHNVVVTIEYRGPAGILPMNEAVRRFMTAAKQPIPDSPAIPAADVAANRLAMLLEEVDEVSVANGFTGLFDAALEWKADRDAKKQQGVNPGNLEHRIAEHIRVGKYDLVEAIDGYVDVTYVAEGGTLENAGYRASIDCRNEVIRNNDTKILPDGTVLKDGLKVIKPDTHIPADIPAVVARHIAEAAS